MTAPACDIPDCGDIFCDDCGERMACTGPEPRACTVTCADCPCSCRKCTEQQQDMRDELMGQLEREARA